MTNHEAWEEVKNAEKENRHELVLSGQKISELIAKNGLDGNLFSLQNLNYLNIHQTCLEEVPKELGLLINLTTLVMHSNKISKLPTSIKNLEKLRVLDCSRNELSSLPNEISNLPALSTLNLSSNLLRILPSQAANVKLSSIDLSNNRFEMFPDVCYSELINLSEIYINGNKISEIPTNINQLQSLKILNMMDNTITAIPGEITDCGKLKEFNLKGNSLKDKRLSKLVDQCRTKQVLDYVKLHCPKSTPLKSSENTGKKTKNKQKSSKGENTDEAVDKLIYTLKILKFPDDAPVIKITDSVKIVRPYIIGCVMRNLSFTEQSFKKFIQLQTKFHEELCERRTLATIATHDLRFLAPGDLVYTAMPPDEIKIKPLMRHKNYTAATLFQQLQTEADNLRREKKRNVYSGIHKYLYLLEGKLIFPCLLDNSNQVISFPPITNSDITRMSPETESMLIEVTSSVSLQACKKVMDNFIKELLINGYCNAKFNNDNEQVNTLTIEQSKVVDFDGNLKVIYPSRTDLNFEENRDIIKVLE